MLSSHKIKIIQSLDKKKFRQKYNLFLVEGNKIIRELLGSPIKIQEIFSVDLSDLNLKNIESNLILASDLRKISFLQNPKDSVALCELPINADFKEFGRQIILDGIQDPGNLGTIIRLADWFGIEQIICSEDTVDFLNPKVIMASMGSFIRVKIVYRNLENYFETSQNCNLATEMNGENIYNFAFPERFNLILGNEGNGIRSSVFQYAQHRIAIPRFGRAQSTESLNVSMAAGIILGQIFSKNKTD